MSNDEPHGSFDDGVARFGADDGRDADVAVSSAEPPSDTSDGSLRDIPLPPVAERAEAGRPGEDDDADARGDAAGDDDARDEGDIAADFLEELLDIADIDGDLEIEERVGRMYVSVRADGSDGLRRLGDPEVVDALQQVTRLAVQAETGDFSRLILDIGGSRDARKRELVQLVDRAMERIDEGASTAALPPMSSYERKIVHDIAAERGFVSESEGEGRDRHTVLRRPR